ncbi:MAG: hypothetical protein AB7J40_03280 [Candidatus Altimarinota bacterium]
MFKHHKHKNPFTYHLLTGLGIIIFWRGVWGLVDLYLFPGNLPLSFTFSIFIGLMIVYANDFSLDEIGQ